MKDEGLMADTKDLEQRHSEALASIAKVVGVEVTDLQAEVRNDPHMERVMTMENIAAAVKNYAKSNKPVEKATEAKS
jgi:hypothetical protein